MNTLIEIDDKKLEIDHRVGDSSRPTLIFLHEGLGCIEMWRDFPAAVAEANNCNLLVYSRLGYGQSDPVDLPRPIRYMHNEALRTLSAVIEVLNINKHILIGHSDGGSIALIYAGGLRPPNLLGMITESAHIFNETITVQSIEEARTAYLETDLRQKLAEYHHDVDNAFWGWNDVWLHPDFRAWNLEEYLPTIDVPLLVMQGLDDEYGTLAQVEAIVNGVGDLAEKCLIADCKHSPHRQQPEITLAAMNNFIRPLVTV